VVRGCATQRAETRLLDRGPLVDPAEKDPGSASVTCEVPRGHAPVLSMGLDMMI